MRKANTVLTICVQTLQSIPADRTRPVNASGASDVDDLTVLRFLDEPNILDALRRRFQRDKIYTYTGPILIVLNPWKSISGLYDSSTMEAYQSAANLAHMPPHAFAVASKAFECLCRTGKNQAILVSGESGAGKTETSKHLMHLIAAVASPAAALPTSSAEGRAAVEKQVLGSNPILEAFGNAKTVRNDNSSRFGKFLSIILSPAPAESDSYTSNPHITTATITTYLLEKSRIVSVAPGERNYHIFYQLSAAAAAAVAKDDTSQSLPGSPSSCSSASSSESPRELPRDLRVGNLDVKNLGVSDPKAFRILSGSRGRSGDAGVGPDDGSGLVHGRPEMAERDERREMERSGLMRTLNAMELVGITPVERAEILRLVAGILHLSALSFETASDALQTIHPDSPRAPQPALKLAPSDRVAVSATLAGQLLGCDEACLVRLLKLREVKVVGEAEKLEIQHSREQVPPD